LLGKINSVVSVQEEREPIFSHGPDGLNLLNPGRFQDLAYDRERCCSFTGGVLAVWWEVAQQENLIGEKVGYIEMSDKDSLQIKSNSIWRASLTNDNQVNHRKSS